MIINADNRSACSATFARRSSRSTSPLARHATTTTRIPASAADAALVPCALDGIRQTSRSGCAALGVIRLDRQQAGVLALRTRVRLQRHRVVAGDRRSASVSRSAISLRSARRVRRRRERMLAGELRPGDRLHLGGRVELHRARSERDHAAVQAQYPCRPATAGSASSRSRCGSSVNAGWVRNSEVRGRDAGPECRRVRSAAPVGSEGGEHRRRRARRWWPRRRTTDT